MNSMYINLKTFEEYLGKLERAQMDGWTDRQTKTHKHFPSLLKSVKKKKHVIQLKIHFQPF